jgi:hypothetical protein
MPSIKSLNLHDTHVTDDTLISYVSALIELEDLDISCKEYTRVGAETNGNPRKFVEKGKRLVTKY